MNKILGVILGVLMCIGGVFCLVNPAATYASISIIFAITLVESAIGYFFIWNAKRKLGQKDGWLLVGAILSLVAGIVIATNAAAQFIVDSAFLGVAAAYMLMMGIFSIVLAFKVKKAIKNSRWVALLVMGILFTICAILSFINPIALAISLGINMAINIIMSGVALIVASLALNNVPEDPKEKIKEEIKERLEDKKEVIKEKLEELEEEKK